jgi:predicted permease
MLASLLYDLRYAVRLIRRRPGSALVTIATMALGIGASTILFSLSWNVLARPLPWPDAARLVRVSETRAGSTRRLPPILTNGTYLAWRDSATTIEEAAGWSQRTMTVATAGSGEPRRSRIVLATPSAFRLMRAQPLVGTVFGDNQASENVAVISHGMWQQDFGGAGDVVGRSLVLDGRPHSIVAVMPPSFAFPDRETRVWIPLLVRPVVGPDGTSRFISLFSAMARLKPGFTPAQAAQEATARAGSAPDPGMTAIALFGSRGAVDVKAVPVLEAMTADVRDGLMVLLAAVGLLLLTATANITSVQLARASSRRREIAVRAALGASGGRLARQMLMESAAIGLIGGLFGVLFAIALQRTLPSVLPPDFPRVGELALDWRVFAFAFALSLTASLAFGLLPAVQAWRVNLVSGLSEGGASAAGAFGRTRTTRIRTVIMAVQVAVACVLIVGASLLIRSFNAMIAFDRGFDTSNILTARVPTPDAAFTPRRRAELVTSILQRLNARPDVVAASMTTVLPFGGADALMGFQLPPPRGASDQPRQVQTAVRTVTPEYFRAIGMRVVEGRGFAATDSTTSAPIVMVNREFARRYFANAAVGNRMRLSLREPAVDWEIAGVVDDARTRSVLDPPQPEMFVCLCQLPDGLVAADPIMVVRTRTDPPEFAPALRQVIRELEPTVALDSMLTMDERLIGSLARPRLYAVVLGGFAAFALIIAGVGLFGVLSYSVAQRAREIGVRTALGARPANIIGLVVREGLIVTVAGTATGLAASFLLARSISAFLFGIVPHDWLTFTAVPALLLAVAALACAVPAHRASRLDPLQVLKA